MEPCHCHIRVRMRSGVLWQVVSAMLRGVIYSKSETFWRFWWGWSRLVASNSLTRLILSVKSGIIKSGEYPQGDKMTSRKLSVEWVMPFCRPIESCLMRATRCLSLKRKRWTTGWSIITSFLITSGTLLRGDQVILGRLLTVKRCVADLGGNLKPVGWICVRSGELAYPLILVGSAGGLISRCYQHWKLSRSTSRYTWTVKPGAKYIYMFH